LRKYGTSLGFVGNFDMIYHLTDETRNQIITITIQKDGFTASRFKNKGSLVHAAQLAWLGNLEP